MNIYIKNGTPLNVPSLCETCARSFIARGLHENEELVVCQALYPERRIRFRVRECSEYAEKGKLTLSQMEDIAWSLLPRGNKREAGFQPPKEMKGDEIVELVLEEKS